MLYPNNNNVEHIKYLPVKKLRELLSELSDDDLVFPNQVGNITILDKEFSCKGFIDFLLEGEVIIYPKGVTR